MPEQKAIVLLPDISQYLAGHLSRVIPNSQYPLDFLPCRSRYRNVPGITANKIGWKTIANVEKSGMHFCHSTLSEGPQFTVLRPEGQMRVRLSEEFAYSKRIGNGNYIRRVRRA